MTFGIDVSRYQQNVDWNKVKDAGASFAIIRIGYRGYGSGALVLDSMFENHFAGARAAGLKVGVYIFSQAINEDEAREEAFACAYVPNGRSLDYPVFFDREYSTSPHTGRADNLSKAERTACAVAFCEELKSTAMSRASMPPPAGSRTIWNCPLCRVTGSGTHTTASAPPASTAICGRAAAPAS